MNINLLEKVTGWIVTLSVTGPYFSVYQLCLRMMMKSS
ncbi:MAG: hypothetical protein Ct9H300mP6_08990 [Gammaproteobacteria bacterium]|nr:MAG: hypothetical protein Ct9H300mP6_08990 [Gammaproteobacteria bacterium]